MAGKNNTGKKGFSGLSDLVSEMNLGDEPQQAPKPQNNPPPVSRVAQPKEVSPKPQEHSTGSTPPTEHVPPTSKDSGSSTGKWIFVGIGVCFVIWLVASGGKSDRSYSPSPAQKPQSYTAPQNSPAPAVAPTSPRVPQSSGLQYAKPSVGTNNLLAIPEIQWCIRENIRIGAMRNHIDTNAGIDAFNQIVNDYNSRCGNYRYREGTQSQAQRNVEPYRSQIVAEAAREAKQLGRPYQPPSSPVSPAPLTSSVPEKPSVQHTKEAQQLLTDLGYKPGPVDGDYGRRTADAVKAFQRNTGVVQNGVIDENLLIALRRAKAEYKPPATSQPRPQPQTSSQPRSSSPSAAATVKPANLSYEEQSRYDTAQRLARLGHSMDWRTSSLADMLDTESRIGTANRLARLGHNVDWRTTSLGDMLDAESKIGTANRLARLGYKVDWRTSSLNDMLDAESRIGTANRLKRRGISVDWRNYSLTQLLDMEHRR